MEGKNLMTCSFFGHRYIDEAIAAPLKNALTNLIANNVDTFLVGHQGDFDRLVLRTLRQPKKEFPQIRYRVVLAYLPAAPAAYCAYTEEETVFPEGLETVPPRYAISWRNRWMIRQSDVVVTYITHFQGSAAQFAKLAKRMNKQVINIPDSLQSRK